MRKRTRGPDRREPRGPDRRPARHRQHDRRQASARRPPPRVPDAGDHETRERLIAVATRLFASRGFGKVTVRDICREASANVAAVNYHFNGKTGLYEHVLRVAIGMMQETTTQMIEAGRGRKPAEQIAACIRVLLTRILGSTDPWIHQLMLHEMADPTPALDMIFEQVVTPRTAYVSGIVARMIECPRNDARVERCVASVQAQVIAAVRMDAVGTHLLRTRPLTPERIDALITHITQFSIAGIRAIART